MKTTIEKICEETVEGRYPDRLVERRIGELVERGMPPEYAREYREWTALFATAAGEHKPRRLCPACGWAELPWNLIDLGVVERIECHCGAVMRIEEGRVVVAGRSLEKAA